MKEASEKIQHKITELENTLQNTELTYEAFDAQINRIKLEINDRNEQVLLPYLFKVEYLAHLKNLNIQKWQREKEIEKYTIHHSLPKYNHNSKE